MGQSLYITFYCNDRNHNIMGNHYIKSFFRCALVIGLTAGLSAGAMAYGHRGGHGGHYGHYGHHRGWGWGGPALFGAVVVGGVLTAAAIAESRAEAATLRRCAVDFPRFDPASGTYIDAVTGAVKVCPYLY